MNRLKRYILFAGDYYYPSGGWDDYAASDDDLETLKATADSLVDSNATYGSAWAHVIEAETMTKVWERG